MNYPNKFLRNAAFHCLSGLIFFCFLHSAFGQEKIHVVKSGETLSAIARKFNTTVSELQKLNPDTRNGLKAGSELKVPGKSEKQSGKTENLSQDQTLKTHEVKPGESLFKIAKKYQVSVKELEEWNQIKNSDLKSGQEILVSKPGNQDENSKPAKEGLKKEIQEQRKENADEATQSHTVLKGQTLSVIARMYGCTVADIKRLNTLKSDNLNLGQTIMVPAKVELVQNSKEPEKPVVKETPRPELQETKMKQVPPVQAVEAQPEAKKSEAVQESVVEENLDTKKSTGIREINNTLGYTRVVETGFAEAIEGDGASKKHLCLHKSAPVGSILQVKNEMNGQSVFVKVIGKLPETGSNEKIIIRISKQAYDRLLAVGKRFPVEVSYPQAQP